MAQIQFLARELPYAAGVAIKKKKSASEEILKNNSNIYIHFLPKNVIGLLISDLRIVVMSLRRKSSDLYFSLLKLSSFLYFLENDGRY